MGYPCSPLPVYPPMAHRIVYFFTSVPVYDPPDNLFFISVPVYGSHRSLFFISVPILWRTKSSIFN